MWGLEVEERQSFGWDYMGSIVLFQKVVIQDEKGYLEDMFDFWERCFRMVEGMKFRILVIGWRKVDCEEVEVVSIDDLSYLKKVVLRGIEGDSEGSSLRYKQL